jgi:hypothetical protein
MLSSLLSARRVAHVVMAVGAVSLFAACGDDDPVEPDDEPDVQTMTLSAGANSTTIDKTTGAASGVLTIPAGTTTITATFKKADGTTEGRVTGADFDVRISPATGTPFIWTPNTNLGGTLVTSGVTSGQTINATVDLFHRAEGHADFGPYTFQLRIQ